MSKRLVAFTRTILLLAATLSCVPSFEGAVLCRWSDGRLALELGTVRCGGPAETHDIESSGTPVLHASPCGTCIDLPLGAATLAVRGPSPVSHTAFVATLAVTPSGSHDDRTGTDASSLRVPLGTPLPSARHGLTPLRC